MANNEIADRIADIESEHDISIKVTGGGTGWTANAWKGGEVIARAKSTSKAEALDALEEELDDADDAEPGEEIEGCSDECQSSTSNICQCACGGANHGIGVTVKDRKPTVVVGDKPCACGCGETTKRTYVPGHDARHHGLIALRKWGREQGFTANTMPTDEALRKLKGAALRKAARERRAVKRAADKATQEAAAATIIANIKPGPKPGKAGTSRKPKDAGLAAMQRVAKATGHDDLPF